MRSIGVGVVKVTPLRSLCEHLPLKGGGQQCEFGEL